MSSLPDSKMVYVGLQPLGLKLKKHDTDTSMNDIALKFQVQKSMCTSVLKEILKRKPNLLQVEIL